MPRMSERSYHGATSHSLTKKPPIMNYTLTDHGLGVEEHMRVRVPGVGSHTMSERSYHGATSRSLTQK